MTKDVLEQLLELIRTRSENIDEIEELLVLCEQKLATLQPSDFVGHEELLQQLIIEYQQLVQQIQSQKNQISKEMGQLQQTSQKAHAYTPPISSDYEFYY
ncbi:flagellar protein FliT [Enterococcus saccharolyticus]|uniref:flagellar protein FliT n=1 Tax=Enterococcus saccharolyticus TaxID=41997 RepID=UPI001E361C1D|nr:flagellar protein FliT [Enterococcus saccharolyticus]MCD5002849.1 flagellar protein FliT [Enterococcus saccharolyticus]